MTTKFDFEQAMRDGWGFEYHEHDPSCADEYNLPHQWVVIRTKAPFGNKERFWFGSTPQQALQNAQLYMKPIFDEYNLRRSTDVY